MRLYFSKTHFIVIAGLLLISAGVYLLYQFSINQDDLMFTRIVYAVSGVLLYVSGSIIIAPIIIKTFLDRILDSLASRTRMTEPPPHLYDNAREAIEKDEYDRARKLLFTLVERYPKAIRPYEELIDILHLDDAQYSLKQARRQLKSSQYQSLVDKIWKIKNNKKDKGEKEEEKRRM